MTAVAVVGGTAAVVVLVGSVIATAATVSAVASATALGVGAAAAGGTAVGAAAAGSVAGRRHITVTCRAMNVCFFPPLPSPTRMLSGAAGGGWLYVGWRGHGPLCDVHGVVGARTATRPRAG